MGVPAFQAFVDGARALVFLFLAQRSSESAFSDEASPL